jgi:hypothetical protein
MKPRTLVNETTWSYGREGCSGSRWLPTEGIGVETVTPPQLIDGFFSRATEVWIWSRPWVGKKNPGLGLKSWAGLIERNKLDMAGFFLVLDCDMDWIQIQINPSLVWCNRTRSKEDLSFLYYRPSKFMLGSTFLMFHKTKGTSQKKIV